MQTYESGDKSWRVSAAQRRENTGLSTGQRLDLKCDPGKMDDSLPCPKPQFLFFLWHQGRMLILRELLHQRLSPGKPG